MNDKVKRTTILLDSITRCYLILILTSTICSLIFSYIIHHSWNIGDWLINYSGGFVRRGFLGEIIILLSSVTSINPGLLVLIIQSLSYVIYFHFSYLLLKKTNIIAYSILIFSPFIFTFQLNSFGGAHRKEIIYFAVLSFLVYARKHLHFKKFKIIFLLITLLYPAIILSHEMLFIFMPYIIAVYFIGSSGNLLRKFTLTSLLALPSLVSFISCLIFSGSRDKVIAIRQSLSQLNYPIPRGGAIDALDDSLVNAVNTTGYYIINNSYIFYIPIILLSLIAFMPISNKINDILKDRSAYFLILSSLLATMPLLISAHDWGRFIYIHLVSFFLLSFLSKKRSKLTDFASKKISILFLIVWALLFRIPHCCITKNNFFVATNIQQITVMNYFF